MGTNYYGRAIPAEKQRKELSDLALSGDVETLTCRLEEFKEIHIGKSSGGWDFLFNLNGKEYYSNESELIEWLKTVAIHDEYGRSLTFDELWDGVVNDRTWNGKPTKSHRSQTQWAHNYIVIDGREFLDCEFS